MKPIPLTDAEFAEVRALAMRLAGINLTASKKMLVVSRWGKRLHHFNFSSFRQYLNWLNDSRSGEELQVSLDLLTTNETYFFREPKHFEFLRTAVLPQYKGTRTLRVWSAACSSGEEPYSLAMLLAAELPHSNWRVLGTDISTRVLASARIGLYDASRAKHIPPAYLQRFCLKGIGPQEGKLLIDAALKKRVDFRHVNLNDTLPTLGHFELVLLRNVMIYFDTDTKARIIERLTGCLAPGGYLIIGHSDSLNGVPHKLDMLQSSIYRKAKP
jgi:chemotaxis protein methyltransferase CheR